MTTEETTALASRPGADAEVINYYFESIKLRAYAADRVIASTEDMKVATDDLAVIARLKKAMEERRKEKVKPHQDEIKAINATYEFLMEPILNADQVTRRKLLIYQAEQDKRRAEQERINQMRMEAAQKEAALNGGEISESVNLVEVSPETPHKVMTDTGSAGQRMIRKWEVVDFSLVPDEFKLIDAGKVTKLVKAGIGSIAGIRIYEEPTLVVNTR